MRLKINLGLVKIFLPFLCACLLVSGCSLLPDKRGNRGAAENFTDPQEATENSTNNLESVTPEEQKNLEINNSDTVADFNNMDEIDRIILNLKGKTLATMADDYEKNENNNNAKNERDLIEIFLDDPSVFQSECSSAEADYAKGIGVEDYNDDEVIYFWPDDENSFKKNLIVSLAIKESLDCSVSMIEGVQKYPDYASSVPAFFYEGLANTMTADILLELVLFNKITKHPEYCQNIEEFYKMGKLCRSVKAGNALKRIKQYYEITGFWDYLKKHQGEFSTLTANQDIEIAKNEYASLKIKEIQDGVGNNSDMNEREFDNGSSAYKENPFGDMTSLMGWIQTPYDILDLGSQSGS